MKFQTNQAIFSASRHIVYNYNVELEKLIFKEKSRICYIISKNGKNTSPQNLSIDVRKFLEKAGFKVEHFKKTYMIGTKDICGIKIYVDKIGETEKNSKQISIRIQGIDDNDLNQKTKTIVDFIKKQCNIEPDINTFTKVGLC